jgi:hypothetical protein
MKTLYRTLAVLALVVIVAPVTAADDDIPNINKRGDDEKAFVEKLGTAVVKQARTSIKNTTDVTYEKKTPKDGRTDFHIKAGYKGGVIGTKYTATIVVHVDTSNKDKWEVLRIEYDDNNKSPIKFNRKNVDEMVKKLNGA